MSEFLADLRASNAENARLAAELSCEQIGSASLADALEATEMDCARLRLSLSFYARHEHWMSRFDTADSKNDILVAHGRHMRSGHGWEEAEAALDAQDATKDTP